MIEKYKLYGESVFDEKGEDFKDILISVVKKTYKSTFIENKDDIKYENR